MIDLKLPRSNIFDTQKDVDDYVLETEALAQITFEEETAIELYKHISRLKAVEDLFFVPEIVLSWEEMALSMIESPEAVFEAVHYEYMCDLHKRGFDAFSNLEYHVLNDVIPEEALFGMIRGFNIDLQNFNKYCKKYNKEILNYYVCQDDELRQKYSIWNKDKCYKEES